MIVVKGILGGFQPGQPTGRLVNVKGHLATLDFSPDGKLNASGTVKVWSLETQKLVKTLTGS